MIQTLITEFWITVQFGDEQVPDLLPLVEVDWDLAEDHPVYWRIRNMQELIDDVRTYFEEVTEQPAPSEDDIIREIRYRAREYLRSRSLEWLPRPTERRREPKD